MQEIARNVLVGLCNEFESLMFKSCAASRMSVNMLSRSEYETVVISGQTQKSFNYCQIFVGLERRNMTDIVIRIAVQMIG